MPKEKCSFEGCKEEAIRIFSAINGIEGDKKKYCIYHHKVMSVDTNIVQLYREANVPPIYKNARLSDVSDAVLKQIPLQSSLFITGATGTGKTHLAIGLLRNDLYRACRPPQFTTMLRLLSRIKATFEPLSQESESAVIQMYSEVSNLYIDDLGVEKVTDWVLNVLYAIIDHRYSYQLRTVYTSNLTIADLADRLGDRLASRINGMCDIIELGGIDKRRKK